MAITRIITPAVTDDAVTLAKMAPGTYGNLITYDASGNPAAVATGTAGQILTSAGAGAPPTFATAATVNGITEYDMFRLTSDTQGPFTLTSNLERVDTSFEKIGTGMSESSGVFTFPSTGKYEVRFTATGKNPDATGERNYVANIQLTTNNSSYSNVASSSNNIGYYSSSVNNWQTTSAFVFLDITDTSNMKVKFNVETNGNSNTYTMSSSASNITYMTFIKFGDT